MHIRTHGLSFLHLGPNRRLIRSQERFHQLTMPTNNHTGKPLKPRTNWNDWLGFHPRQNSKQLFFGNRSLLNAVEKMEDQGTRDSLASNLRYARPDPRRSPFQKPCADAKSLSGLWPPPTYPRFCSIPPATNASKKRAFEFLSLQPHNQNRRIPRKTQAKWANSGRFGSSILLQRRFSLPAPFF